MDQERVISLQDSYFDIVERAEKMRDEFRRGLTRDEKGSVTFEHLLNWRAEDLVNAEAKAVEAQQLWGVCASVLHGDLTAEKAANNITSWANSRKPAYHQVPRHNSTNAMALTIDLAKYMAQLWAWEQVEKLADALTSKQQS